MKKWLNQNENFSARISSDFFCWLEDHEKKTWQAWEGYEFEVDKLISDLKLNYKSHFIFKCVGKDKVIQRIKTLFQVNDESKAKYVLRHQAFEVMYFKSDFKFKVSIELPNITATPKLQVKEKVKVLLVDDSKTILTILSTMLKSDPNIEIVGMLTNPLEAEKYILEKKPDVITLDIHMPEMNGVDLLKKIKNSMPVPTIMITSLNIQEGGLVLDALENGAFDYIQKPKMEDIAALTPILIEKIKAAANSTVATTISLKKPLVTPSIKFGGNLDHQLIALGASTGGTNALADLLTLLPENVPPIVIVQHIPPVFSAAFAKRLNELCKFAVKESEDGDILRPGLAIVARGGVQFKIIKRGDKLVVVHTDDPPLNRFKPSVDYLFNSVAEIAQYRHIAAALLTGMGNDGAHGMLNMRKAEIETIAQDEKTCVVFGMPREAIEIGGATYIEPLPKIAERLASVLDTRIKHKLKAS